MNSEVKSAVLSLKNWPWVTSFSQRRGWVNTYTEIIYEYLCTHFSFSILFFLSSFLSFLSTLLRPLTPFIDIHRKSFSHTAYQRKTVAATQMLYRNTKVKVCSRNGDTDYFDIVAGVLQGDTSAPYLFIICQDYVLRTSIDKIKENGFKLTKERSRCYPAKTITDADYADDIALLVNLCVSMSLCKKENILMR